MRDGNDMMTVARYNELREKLGTRLAQKEAFWKQRANVFGFRDGDTNSKFFYAMASARRKQNEIMRLERVDGSMVEDQNGMCDVLFSILKIFSNVTLVAIILYWTLLT